MADSEYNAFSLLANIPDDSTFVHDAMQRLGFSCEFSDLQIPEMQLALALALHLKRTQGRPETWES
jgi:hypothetical protein